MKEESKIAPLFLGLVCILCGCTPLDVLTPTIHTNDITGITEMTALTGGTIVSDNGSMVTERGVCWSTHKVPVKDDNYKEDSQSGSSPFFCKLEGLAPLTTYYVRAYATNAGGVAYGEEKLFTTKSFEVTTIPPYFISATSAISGATVSFDSDRPTALARGVCWNKFPNPTISDNKTIDGSGSGSFSSTINGLLPFTTYYVRAYVTNVTGTTYGNEVQFTTQNGVINVVTNAVSNLTSSNATFSADVSGDGGSSVTDRGFCWSKLTNPTITDNKVSVGNGTGFYSKQIGGLSSNTRYYVRAFATNSLNTIYGDEVNFTTLVGVPKACFDASIVGYKVSFTNCSEYPATCLWDFGDGTTSSEKAPVHLFNDIGTYNVKLTISNDGLTDCITKSVEVTGIVDISDTPGSYMNGSSPGHYIDVERDGVDDLFIGGWGNTGPTSSYGTSYIYQVSNIYEVVCDSVLVNIHDTTHNPADYFAKFELPKIFSLGDIVLNSDRTSVKDLTISYYRSYHLDDWYHISYNVMRNKEIGYIGVIKRDGGVTKIGWIKIDGNLHPLKLKIPMVCTNILINE